MFFSCFKSVLLGCRLEASEQARGPKVSGANIGLAAEHAPRAMGYGLAAKLAPGAIAHRLTERASRTLLVAVALAVSLVNMGAVLAQSSSAVAPNNMGAPRLNCGNSRPMKRYTGAQNYMYQTLELKDPVSPAYLPTYRGSGAKYTGGVYYPQLKARQCYVMRFLAKDAPLEIMRTYRESLMQDGWQINEQQTNNIQMTACRKANGLFLTLCVYPSSKPGFKTSFEIKYLSAGAVQNQ